MNNLKIEVIGSFDLHTKNVILETKSHHEDFVNRIAISTVQLQEKTFLEALPDDLLLQLFNSYRNELNRRDYKHNTEKFGALKSAGGSEIK